MTKACTSTLGNFGRGSGGGGAERGERVPVCKAWRGGTGRGQDAADVWGGGAALSSERRGVDGVVRGCATGFFSEFEVKGDAKQGRVGYFPVLREEREVKVKVLLSEGEERW